MPDIEVGMEIGDERKAAPTKDSDYMTGTVWFIVTREFLREARDDEAKRELILRDVTERVRGLLKVIPEDV